MPEASEPARSTLLLALRAGSVHLALTAQMVEEVCEESEFVALPRMPAHVCGLMSVRGEPVPVVDLARFLEVGQDACDPREEARTRRVVVIHDETYRVGFLCQRVFGLLRLPAERMLRPELIQGGRLRRFTQAEVDGPRGLAAVLDVPAVLDAARLRPASP